MAADSPVFLRHLRLHQSRLPIYHPLTKKLSFSFPGFGYRVQHCMGQCLLCSDCRVWLRVRADLHFLPPSSSLHVVLIPHRLSVVILKDQEAAVRASVLFCFSPASIFYSSIYSETLFTLFSVGGLYHLMSGKDVIAVL
ncbi:unnamed protein product [Malus baccata var. baccata]